MSASQEAVVDDTRGNGAPSSAERRAELQKPTSFAALGGVLLLASLLGLLAPFKAVQALFSESAFGRSQEDTSVPHDTSPPAGSAGGAFSNNPTVSLLAQLLTRLVACGLASTGIVNLVLHGAKLRGGLTVDLYQRLLQVLALWGTAGSLLTLFNAREFKLLPLLALLGLFGSVAVNALRHLNDQMKRREQIKRVAVLHSGLNGLRSGLYGVLSVFLALEALPILLFPKASLEGVFGHSCGAVGRVLWQLTAVAVHTVVPAALLNLKPLTERHELNSSPAAFLNLAALIPGLVHLFVVARSALGGLNGPLGPVIGLAWLTTTLLSAVNLPARLTKGHYS